MRRTRPRPNVSGCCSVRPRGRRSDSRSAAMPPSMHSRSAGWREAIRVLRNTEKPDMEKITADDAADLVEDGDAILISGSGGGHSVPEALLAAVERRFLAEQKPRGITSVS